jgi:hypothetical protein
MQNSATTKKLSDDPKEGKSPQTTLFQFLKSECRRKGVTSMRTLKSSARTMPPYSLYQEELTVCYL